jgi:nucleolar pre-ribosomal-associated protein 1
VQVLADLIGAVLNERFNKFSAEEMNSRIRLAEWRPLINLLHFLKRTSDQQNFSLFAVLEQSSEFDASSLCFVTGKVEEMLSQQQTNQPDDVAAAFLFSVICAPAKDIISGFPDLLAVVKTHFPYHLAFLSSVLYLQRDYLAKIAGFWPDMFFCSIRPFKDDFSVNHVNIIEDKWKSHSVSVESASISAFLSASPFCALLPSVLSLAFSASDKIREAYNNAFLRLLQDKLTECTFSELMLDLRVILFWSHHLLSSYTVKCSNTLEQLCHLCSALVDSVFERIQVLTADNAHPKSAGRSYTVRYIQDVLDSVLKHPLISLSLPCPLSSCQDLADGSLEHLEEALTAFSKENLHHRDRFVLNLLSKVYDLLLMVSSSEANYSIDFPLLQSVFSTPKLLLESILSLFKEKFELCVDKGDLGLLLPNFYMVRTLSKFMSPVKLLELANCMFTKLDSCSSSSSAFISAVLICLYIADITMEMMYSYLQQADKRSASCLLWDLEIHNSDITAIQRLYHSILCFATKLNLELADHCLLKMLDRIHHTGRSAGWCTDSISFHMILSAMAMNTPIDILHHCIFSTSKIKAKVVLLLLEASPMHMSLFGQIFMEILKNDTSILQVKDYVSNGSWAQEDGAILLLPSALSYLNSNTDVNGQFAEFLEPIPIFYGGLLLGGNGFSRWKDFVTRSIFEEDFSDFAPTSAKEAMLYFSETLLGKSVTMLSSYFTVRDMSQKKRMETIASIVPESSELLVSDVNGINPTAGKGIVNVVNELFAKVALIRLLLSSRKSLSNEPASERDSKRLNKAKLNIISTFVRTLDKIVRNFPWSDNVLSQSAKEQKAICSLEYVILKNIIELSSEIQTHLNQLKSIPFINQFIRSSLLHRFSDPITIKAIRCILVVLSQGNVPADEILELILGHSSFVSTITCSEGSECPSACNTARGLLQPCPSILKFIDSSFMEENKSLASVAENRRTETIRLLRLLYDLKSRQQKNSLLNESRELVFLLLSVYGATLGETDLEILHLMNEIESSECRVIDEVDHLWGSAVLKFREELKLDFSKFDTHDTEDVEITERRKTLFRENIPVDSKLCAKTALQYCYKRSSRASSFTLEQLHRDSFADNFEVIIWNNGEVWVLF